MIRLPASPVAPVPAAAPPADPEPSLRGIAMAAAIAIGVGFGGFVGWACLAPMDAAAIAGGTVIVDSQRKTLSHLEGGILQELLVREGDRVAQGQVLLRLDITRSQAAVAQLESQYWAAAARTVRLRLEQNGAAAFAPSPELVEAAARDPVATAAVAAESRLFDARKETYEGTRAVQKRRIGQLREQISALEAQRKATADRLSYTAEELKAVRALLEKGYERKPRALELQRLTAELRGELGELEAKRAEVGEAIAAAELEVLNLESERRTEINNDLQQSQTSAADLAERLRGARDVLARHEVTAPQAGRVVQLRFVTPGSVVPAGSPILDLVPDQDELVVEAKVAPTDIDTVRPGHPANVRLTAFKQRQVPPVRGSVVTVSPDLLRDERTGAAYFVARVRLDGEEVRALNGVELYPGMPAEVMIAGTRRTAMDYFLSPITDGMRRAFREE